MQIVTVKMLLVTFAALALIAACLAKMEIDIHTIAALIQRQQAADVANIAAAQKVELAMNKQGYFGQPKVNAQKSNAPAQKDPPAGFPNWQK